jgi:UDP-N-acetyl-D-glucosamine dehydrogenase
MNDSPAAATLKARISDRRAVVGIIGLGYVGLPLMAAFHAAGFPVVGFDTDPAKIKLLHAGTNYLKHLGTDLVSKMRSAGRFDATIDMARLGECDIIISCVPTPLGPHHEPDLAFVEKSAADAAATARPGQLIVLESSTYPGTTREIFLPKLEARGLKLGQDVFLAYSPEREDPGRKDHNTRTIPKLVGGCCPASTDIACALYSAAIAKVVPVSTAEVAEAAKLLENIYRAVNIALVNEMKLVLSAMGIDVWEVVAAAATKPFGFQAFYPGPGLGGHCIPIDPFYLTWKAREVGQPTRFIELAGEVNHRMPAYVVDQLVLALNQHKKCVNGAKILILGLAYKPDVDDVRESPSFELIERLHELGAHVDFSDPHVQATHKMRKYDLQMSSIPLSPAVLRQYDAVVVATHHAAFDWDMIAAHSPLVVDTRNALAKWKGQPNIVKA